jgi:rhodanese-related sulfurtransferase
MDEQPSNTVVDVRTRQEYEAGHIEGAMNIPNETIGSDKVDALPDLEATILLYCRSGARSSQAARKLIALGYTNVLDFGGIIDWPYEVVK